MSPPTPPVFRVVWGKGYAALYQRSTDPIGGKERTENWELLYVGDDPDEAVIGGMVAALSRTAHGRFLQLSRDALCTPSADSPFPESLPGWVLESDSNPLELRAEELRKELAELEERIARGDKE